MARRFRLEDDDEERVQPGRWTRFKEFLGFGPYEDEEDDEEEDEPLLHRRGSPHLRVQPGRTQRIHKISVRSLEDASYAADMLKERRPVILNLESTPEDVARRTVDFVSGATYALDGYYERVGEKVFLFTPSNTLIELENEEIPASTKGLYGIGR